MGALGFIGMLLVAAGGWYWGALPRLRRQPWWDAFAQAVVERVCALGARLWAVAGNSRTIAVAYSAELMGLLDEARLLDWSALLGSDKAGRVMVIMGAVMIGLRLVTRTAVTFRPASGE